MIRYWLPSLALLALAGVVGCELDRLLWVRCSDYVLRSARRRGSDG